MTIVQLNPTAVFPEGADYNFNYTQELNSTETYRLSYTTLEGEIVVLDELTINTTCIVVELLNIQIDQNECEDLTLNFSLTGTDKVSIVRIDRSLDQITWENVSSENVNNSSFETNVTEVILDDWNGKAIFYRVQAFDNTNEIIFEHIERHLLVCTQEDKTEICPNLGAEFVDLKFSISTLEEDVNVYLYEMSGKLINHIIKDEPFIQGDYDRRIDITYLLPGQYVLFVTKGEFQKGLKFQKFDD